MANDDRYGRYQERGGRGRGEDRGNDGRGSDERYSHGRRQGLGERNFRGERDDPDYGSERYGAGAAEGYGSGGMTSDPDSRFGAPGYDADFGGPRFDRVDAGSTGTHGVHPVSSPYGGAVGVRAGGGFGSSARRYAQIRQAQGGEGRQGGGGDSRGSRFDPHYAEWRNRQIEEYDRDYHEYRTEQQSRFEQEFGSWREKRAGQRQAVGRVREHMEVVGSDDSHVGTVDGTQGDRIILTRSDAKAGGHHHSIPCGWIDSVDDKVRLNLTAEEATKRWRDEEHSRALFERDDQGQSGPGILNRSFSGTYPDED